MRLKKKENTHARLMLSHLRNSRHIEQSLDFRHPVFRSSAEYGQIRQKLSGAITVSVPAENGELSCWIVTHHSNMAHPEFVDSEMLQRLSC
jgi:hypothetical protein